MLAEHQRDAVVRIERLLRRHRCAILADAPGLGKSFVAAETARRWSEAGGCVDLVIPAALVDQWRETLRRFSVGARITTHDSIPGRKENVRPRLVVVDEAHAFRNPRTARYAALARFSFDAALLLVSATPVCNSADDLHALLRLGVDDDALANVGIPSIDAAFERRDLEAIDVIVAELVLRRGREAVPPDLAFGTLDRRVIRHTVPAVPQVDALEFPLVRDARLLHRFLQRRLESSEAALLESLRRQRRFYERALSAVAAGRTLPRREYRRAFGREEDREIFQEVLFWELFAPPAGATDAAALRAELGRIDAAASALSGLPPGKFELLESALADVDGPALVFTHSAATARDLQLRLGRTRRCGLVTSREHSRARVLAAFRAGLLDCVVSTDMSAEGLDLQRAGTVVHYDLPWNPVKLDQRNGRAWRIGQQRSEVRAIYFLPRSRSTRIVETITRKNRTRRRILDVEADRALPPAPCTLRPRLTSDAAFLALRKGPGIAEDSSLLARRHRAGVELELAEIAESGDRRRLGLLTLHLRTVRAMRSAGGGEEADEAEELLPSRDGGPGLEFAP
jgi:superfamily II DNA or RNA helicase